MKKKILKGIALFFLVVLIALIAAPFLFKGKIKQWVLRSINEQVEATVAFDDVSLSLIRSFPNATVRVEGLSIINNAPFEGDTLFYAKSTQLKMSVRELFKGEGEAMQINSIRVEDSKVNLIINEEGIANYDIAIKKEEDPKEDEPSSFALQLQEYTLENFNLIFDDRQGKMKVNLHQLSHQGKGDLTATQLDLETFSKVAVSFDMNGTNYLNKVPLQLDAVLGIDFDQQKYAFKNNEALIQQLPLKFDGFIQMKEEGILYDLTFDTPSTSFAHFLSLIPSSYQGSLDNITTTGDLLLKGFAKGLQNDETIPAFELLLRTDNASFKYPDLPKTVQNIKINTLIKNETGKTDDTFVQINQINFTIDQDRFDTKALIRNLSTNPQVDAKLYGVINLKKLSQAYPLTVQQPLSGILTADVETSFNMAAIENEQYHLVQNKGNINLKGFDFTTEEGQKFEIAEAHVLFNPKNLNLQKFEAKTGKTDMAITGVLHNFYGYVFQNQNLKGDFNLNSNSFAVSDFMSKSTSTESTATQETIKIPAFLDCSLTAKANTVYYDNLTLRDVSGKLTIKDESVLLENLRTSIFGGTIVLNGGVSTRKTIPDFEMNLGMNGLDITQSFTQLDVLKSVAPIAGVINGRMNSNVTLVGKLNPKTMTPEMNTLTGNLMGQLLESQVQPENSKLLSALDANASFIDLKKINLNNLKGILSFQNGRVQVQPFDLKIQDITLNVGGTHGFDQSMDYQVKFDVPAKYLGPEVNNLLN
ncbi:MAG: AsmA-like C-terminal region-containing protein, partial [Flavobacterium sp.]